MIDLYDGKSQLNNNKWGYFGFCVFTKLGINYYYSRFFLPPYCLEDLRY